MKVKKKMRFILQAARTTVEVIERNGFKCMLVGQIAGYLHGSRTLPQDVSLVTLPDSDGRPTPEIIAELLQDTHPFHFRDVLHQRDNTSNIRYYGSSERGHFCIIHLLRVDKTSPIFIGDIVRLKDLPTAHVLIDLLCPTSTTPLVEKPSECANHLSPQAIPPKNPLLAAKEETSSNTLFNQVHHLPQLTPTPFSPAGLTGSTAPSPPTTNLSNLAFVNSLHEIDSNGSSDDQLHDNSNIDPRIQTICRITKKLVQLLLALKVDCALFGSAACWLYGNTRVPDDIDLLVFPPPDLPREHLKQILQQTYPHRLRLERPFNPDAPFKVLYFHLDGINGPRGFFPGNKCKIDILIPGILHLPCLSAPQIIHLGGVPVIPFSLLLLQKLQGWDDHRKLRWTFPKKYAKATIDARDLEQLLTLEQHVAPLRVSQPWKDESLFTEEFMLLSRQRVRDFCDGFPACKRDFKLLGLCS